MKPMEGRVVVVTGGSDGIGKRTALELAKLGAETHIVGRDEAKTKAAAREIARAAGTLDVGAHVADLSSLASIRQLAFELGSRLSRLDVLVNNAGAAFQRRELSADGREMTFALNHLGYAALTMRMLPLIERSAPSRIVVVASGAHRGQTLDLDDLEMERRYSAWTQYGRTKLMNVMFASWLASRLDPGKTTANSLHPGFVNSHFGARFSGPLGLIFGLLKRTVATSVEKGAETPVFLASSPEVANVSGRYFENRKPAQPSDAANDRLARDRLMNATLELIGPLT